MTIHVDGQPDLHYTHFIIHITNNVKSESDGLAMEENISATQQVSELLRGMLDCEKILLYPRLINQANSKDNKIWVVPHIRK